jgi:hypothetical protein
VISAFLVIYPDRSAAAGSGANSPEVTFEFARDGKAIGRATSALPAPDERHRIEYVATFPLDGFAPGVYELRAVALQSASTDTATTRFTLVP